MRADKSAPTPPFLPLVCLQLFHTPPPTHNLHTASLCTILCTSEHIEYFAWRTCMWNGLDFSWHWSPIALIGLVILCLLYSFGIRQTRKSNSGDKPLKKRTIIAFIFAVVLMALVFLTPIDTISPPQLSSSHIIHPLTL